MSRPLIYAVTNHRGLTYYDSKKADALKVGRLWAMHSPKVVMKVRRTGQILAKWIDGVRQ